MRKYGRIGASYTDDDLVCMQVGGSENWSLLIELKLDTNTDNSSGSVVGSTV